ncbi:MAG: gliding motility-associated ABC transporter substrate-binding protein GldG [Bacteroidia bacterium]
MVEDKKKSLRTAAILNAVIIIAIIVVVNILSSIQYFRLDLTSDKVHTLSESSRDVIDSIPSVVNIEIYLEGENLTPELLKLQRAIDEKFQDFRELAKGKIKYTFVNPNDEDINVEEFQKHLYETGLQNIVVNVKEENSFKAVNIWPCAKVYYGERAANIQFIEQDKSASDAGINTAINELEYAITKAIFEAINTTRKRIVFVEGHGELSESETWIINNQLSQLYYTERKKIDEKLDALFGFDMAIVAKPQQPFSDKDAYILDQFIMRGGKVIWLIDPVDVKADSLKKSGQTMALAQNFNIENQLFKYGVRLNNNLVIDKRCGPIMIPGYGSKLWNWYFHPLAALDKKGEKDTVHPISKNVNPVKLQYASTIDPVGNEAIKKTVILESSEYSMHYMAPARVNYGIIQVNPNFSNANNRPNQPMALLLEGKFTSYFTNYISPEYLNNPQSKHKEESDDNKMIVIADGDLIRNEIMLDEQGREMYIGLDYEVLMRNMQYVPKIYGNTTFFLNAVDYLLGQDRLVQLRARETVFRPLDEDKIKGGKKSFWKFVNIILPILLLLIIAIVLWLIRRVKYKK